ncbi:hypothetical protein [Pseudonocardia sp. 73-21]|uniref:hypothetical protein n=1 Tax=Pseudonocardia sp. 73-21 TaxID=1895809 RepID=UPI00095D1E81|nr:hypothetical protein [Pseudonocardia sp. 73-21]OJY47606.1 MAG: hypothetical protein BGP03_33275 [Pseudonocardia sp. 73-21]
MGRRLSTYVHVDNVAYGPEDEVPAEVAERITAPGVWADEPEKPAAPVVVVDEAPAPAPSKPSRAAAAKADDSK